MLSLPCRLCPHCLLCGGKHHVELKCVLDFRFVLLISVVFFFFFPPKDEVCAMMPFTGLSVFTAVESIHLVTSLAVQWLRLCFQCRGQGCHPCLVEELRPFLLCCATKNKIHLVR